MRRPLLLVSVVSVAAAALLRRRRAQRTESDVWTQASTPPDLR